MPVVIGFQNPFIAIADAFGTRRFGPQTLNHQSFLPNSDSTFGARRKSMASRMLLDQQRVPPGGSIMAAATSRTR